MTRTIRRWSDHDRYFGPFTYARDKRGYRPMAAIISSGDDDEYPGSSLRFSGFGHTLIIAMPSIIKPSRQWKDLSQCDWATSPGYWDIHERQYGFSYAEGFLQVFLGRQTNDSSTDQIWTKFLPWTQWRFIRHSLYGLSGEHLWTEPEDGWRAYFDAKEKCPSASFDFEDFDGERIVAKTVIEEREWKFGTGWFKWLSLFRRPKIRRSLDIAFPKETGDRKGSWKGGTVGHSIDMLPGELHGAAFRRYCAEHRMKFVGPTQESATPSEAA
jgi:hypothetical protein